MKYTLGLLLAVSFNANACYVVNGYVQCPPAPATVYISVAPLTVYVPQQPYMPPPPISNVTVVPQGGTR